MVAILSTLSGILYLAFFFGFAAFLASLAGLRMGWVLFLSFLSLCTPGLTIAVLVGINVAEWVQGTWGKPRLP